MANTPRSVGQELLNVPFPEMVEQMGMAIATAQMALDLNSMRTAQALANTMIPAGTVVTAIKETVNADGVVTGTEVLYNDKEMPLLVYGINPTFYAFSETIIEVKMTITMSVERSVSLSFGTTSTFSSTTKFAAEYKTGGLLSLLAGTAKASVNNTTTVARTSTMNASYTSKFNYKEEGSSLIRTTLKPLPPPERMIPKITITEPGAPPPGP
ncbi:MAG: hypothetical protein WCP77_08270 [Roseococcus sp.]